MEQHRVRRPYPSQAAQPRYGIAGRPVGARVVGSYVPRLTRKVFEKFGFSAATLITEWAQIAGPEIAAWCQPERLRWPRSSETDAPDAPTRRTAATLLLRVEPARALDIQYRQRQIVERINAYFGYRAVGDLRIVQAPLSADEAPRRVLAQRPSAVVAPSAELGQIADEPLRAALARLQSNLTRA